MRWALLTCASLSLAAHALAVTLLPPVERPARTTHHRPAGAPTAWQMRLTQAPAQANTQVESEGEGEGPTQHLISSDDAKPVLPADDIGLTSDAPLVASTEAIEAEPSPTTPVALTAGELSGDSAYIPRPLLTVPPVPQEPVIMTPPKGAFEAARISGILSLYIDEQGRVHHIAANGAPMPPEFEEAARQTFSALTFRPGILDGAAVKSRIRIEVVFDNTPVTDDVPAAVSAKH